MSVSAEQLTALAAVPRKTILKHDRTKLKKLQKIGFKQNSYYSWLFEVREKVFVVGTQQVTCNVHQSVSFVINCSWVINYLWLY